MKAICKLALGMLLVAAGIFTGSLNIQAATKPYWYEFSIDSGNTFNGINSGKQLVITFDKEISVQKDIDNDGSKDDSDLFTDNLTVNPIYVVPEGGKKEEQMNLIKDVTLDSSKKVLTITFKNLDFIDYTNPDQLNYEIVIEKESLQFDQLNEIRLPFYLYDILPGFDSTFVKSNSSIINNNIFKYNAPRDVVVHIPTRIITEIETIHRYDGLITGGTEPALTNIDVIADTQAQRLKVTLDNGVNDEFSRDLMRRDDVDGFSMGQAGIDGINETTFQSAKDFQLKAYNGYGRFLEQKNFKIKVTNPKSDFIINDYIVNKGEFKPTYTLYELMENQTLLEEIISGIPVSQLDALGITYKEANSTVNVGNLEELQLALANPKIKIIKLPVYLNLGTESLVIGRTVTIESAAAKSELEGNVELKGTDINVRINKVDIKGDLTVDVGANGTAILDTVNVNGTTTDPATKIVSGGTNSVHLNGFTSTNGITFANTTPIRLVTSQLMDPLTLDGTAEVTLEGEFDTVNVKRSTTLNNRANLKIGTLFVEQDQTLTVAGVGGQIPTNIGPGTVTFTAPVPLMGSPVNKNVVNTDTIVEIDINVSTSKLGGYDLTDVLWEVTNKDVFGTGTDVKYVGGSLEKLVISNLELTDVIQPITKNVILRGSDSQATFEVTIPVTLTVER